MPPPPRHGTPKPLGRDYALAVIGMYCWSAAVAAGDWRFTPRFSIDESVTDNVTLVETDKLADLITVLTPGLSLRGTSARLSSSVDYNLQHLIYADNSQFSESNHQLQGNTSAVIVKNWLYFDTRSTVSQQILDNTAVISRNNRSRTSGRRGNAVRNDNRSDVVTYEFGPTVRHRFGSWFNAEMRFVYDRVEYTSAAASDLGNGNGAGIGSSDEQEFTFTVSSGEEFARIPMTMRTVSRETTFDSGRKQEYDQLEGTVSYVISRKLRITAGGGVEDSSSEFRNGNSSGPSWHVGCTWTPSVRTTVSGRWGKRVFGNSFDVSANHRRRRWQAKFDYNEDVRTNNQTQRELSLVPLVDENGDPFFDPGVSDDIPIPIDTPSVTEDAFVEKSMAASFVYNARRTSTQFRFFRSDRVFGRSSQDELQTGFIAMTRRSLSPRLSSGVEVVRRKNERGRGSGIAGATGKFVEVSPYLMYILGPHTAARVTYGFASNEGGQDGVDYTENSLSVRLQFHL